MKNYKDVVAKYSDKLTGDGWALVYTYDRLVIDKIPDFPNQANDIDFDTIREARFFTKTGEVKIWRYNNKLHDRYRDDSQLNIYEDKMNLWGNKVDGKTLIQENRGIKLTLPLEINQDTLPLKVHVHNYYEFDEDGLIVFKDARLVKITNKKDEEL